jgi:iron complex transport system ATP-binding protein
MSAISINNLEFEYLSEVKNQAFHLSIPIWNVEAGEFVSVLGPNGCGKSTLLRLICGLAKHQNGKIKIGDTDILCLSHKELAKRIAFVPQSHDSIFPFSVNEIVMMGRTPYLNTFGFEQEDDRKIVDEALSLMRVEHLRKKCINEISGGEAQRVYLARALTQETDILILDEPNAHLDLENQILIFDFLKKLNEEKHITIITVSHDLNLVGIYSKKVVLMKQGKIVLDGNKSQVLNRKNIAEIFKINAAIFSTETSASFNVLINPIAEKIDIAN